MLALTLAKALKSASSAIVVPHVYRKWHSLPRCIPFPNEPGYDACRSVLLIQRMAELLPRRLVLLLDGKRLEEDGIVLVLERVQ